MVHRGGRVYMPTSTGGNVKMMGTRTIRGGGNGSVLLNQGGAGAGSSYDSIDDYIQTTGRSIPMGGSSGRGLGGLSKKLESLMLKPKDKKSKNINFSL